MEQEANTKCSFSYAANCDSFALHTAMTKSHERYIDLISNALLFVAVVKQGKGRNRIRGAPQRSHHALISVYDESGNVIETPEHKGDFKD